MAENRELTLARSINQRNPHHDPKTTARGYYLALTFGTLLSSQGADAQKLYPLGLRVWLDVQHYAGFQMFPDRGSGPAALPGRAAQRERYTTLGGPCRGGPEPVLLCPTWSTTPVYRRAFRASVRPASRARCTGLPAGPALSDREHKAGSRRGLPPSGATPVTRARADQATPRGRNCTLTRGPTGLVVLGMQCSHVRWHEPPMTTRSP